MRLTSYTCLTLVVAIFTSTYIQCTISAPFNFDKTNLTPEQELAIKRIDDLLNDFLQSILRDYLANNPQKKFPIYEDENENKIETIPILFPDDVDNINSNHLEVTTNLINIVNEKVDYIPEESTTISQSKDDTQKNTILSYTSDRDKEKASDEEKIWFPDYRK
ncbi:hypothetical protein SK128_004354 [Halocaridina rubra]|uniref:Uncharacterized protein n=1 Tax=Halocaridina rubra TaxID=373956 RepID=A0AAN8X8N1_HALRR